jgi:CRISPR-associated protein Cas1
MQSAADRALHAKTVDQLRGLEGHAAREYFGLLRTLLKRPMGFSRRAYHPPPDPVNALLSFGYTLLLNDLVSACQIVGLDPHLGLFHAIDYGRPSLALDLEEAFRPVIVDSLVLDLINHDLITKGDFQKGRSGGRSKGKTPRGILMREGARRRYVEAYETRLNTTFRYKANGRKGAEEASYRRAMILQAELMARVILGKESQFSPLRIR